MAGAQLRAKEVLTIALRRRARRRRHDDDDDEEYDDEAGDDDDDDSFVAANIHAIGDDVTVNVTSFHQCDHHRHAGANDRSITVGVGNLTVDK